MTLTDQVIKNIIKRLIKGQDYRIEVIALINAEFLEFAIEFFKQIVDAKLKNKDLTQDWYKNFFLDPKLTSKEIAINSGLNTKTITNMYNSASKQIVINASNEHYDVLYPTFRTSQYILISVYTTKVYLTIKTCFGECDRTIIGFY